MPQNCVEYCFALANVFKFEDDPALLGPAGSTCFLQTRLDFKHGWYKLVSHYAANFLQSASNIRQVWTVSSFF
jgi:hypothetical protein